LATVAYRIRLAADAILSVWFITRRDEVLEYAIVLLVEHDGLWHTARVYDNAHGRDELHRHTLANGKQAGEGFQAGGTAGQAMRAARDEVLHGYAIMIDTWRR
jgi:hypothetical protein